MTVAEASDNVRVSSKTVRAIFMALRIKLLEAVYTAPKLFQQANFFMCRDGKLSERGQSLLHDLSRSEEFEARAKRHFPNAIMDETFAFFIFEAAVRALMIYHFPMDPNKVYSDYTLGVLPQIEYITGWIRENKNNSDFLAQNAGLLKDIEETLNIVDQRMENEEMQTLLNHTEPHRYVAERMYDNLRRYLLKYPILKS